MKIHRVSDLPRVWIKRCKECNERFLTVSVKGQAKYCKKCRKNRFKKIGKLYYEPRKDICKQCNKAYVKLAGHQLYCKECQYEKQKEYHKRWREKVRKEKYWNEEM
jgi:hypothetical protein